MADYDNTNRGALWPNKEKATENHSDFTGTINVDGVEYFLNGWKRKEGAKAGAPSLSVSVKRKDKQPNAAASSAKQDQISTGRVPVPMSQRLSASDHDDSDIPF